MVVASAGCQLLGLPNKPLQVSMEALAQPTTALTRFSPTVTALLVVETTRHGSPGKGACEMYLHFQRRAPARV
jgi:hypothetical protein